MTVLNALPAIMTRHGVPAHGVVHVGAHEAQELDVYRACGFSRMLWVEPNPDLAARLRNRGLEVAECAVVRRPGPTTLYLTKWDQQSSVLRPIRYKLVGNVQVDGRRLDQLDTAGCNVLVVDVQGAEMSVLRSGPLDQYDMLVVECSTVERYERQATAERVLDYCHQEGFRSVAALAHGTGRIVDHVLVAGRCAS